MVAECLRMSHAEPLNGDCLRMPSAEPFNADCLRMLNAEPFNADCLTLSPSMLNSQMELKSDQAAQVLS